MARDVLITPASGLIDFLDTSVSKATLTLGTNGILVLTGGSNPIVIETSTSGSSALRVDGTNGTLFEVVDDLSGSLMSVNDAAGLPVLEVFADSHIVAGRYGQNDFYLDTNGNLGLGTSGPASLLHLQSSASTTLLRIDNTNAANDAAILLTDNNNPTGEGLKITYDSSVGDTYFNNIYASSTRAFTFAKGDFGSGTSLVTIYNDGNVGIGTTTPNQLLEVANSSGGATINISTDQQPGSIASPKYTNLDFSGYSNRVNARIQSWDESSNTGYGYLTFHTNTGTTLTEKLRITRDGNVGIGTTDPADALSIQVPSGTTKGIFFQDGSVNTYGTKLKYEEAGNKFFIEQIENSVQTGILTILRADGNVGIGTTSPSAALHIIGKQMITTGANASPASTDYLYIGGDGLASSDAAIYIGNRGNGTGYGWRLYYYGTGSGNDNKLHIRSENLGSPVDAMTFLQDGNIGIGTTGPTDKLHLIGNLKIGGNINPTIDASYNLGTSSLRWLATYTAKLLAGDGSVSAPGITFINDTDTGLFRSTSGYIDFATNGQNPVTIYSSGMYINASAAGMLYQPTESGATAGRYWLMFDYTNNASYPFLTNRTPSGKVVIKTGVAAGGGENTHFTIEGGDGTVDAYFENANVGIGQTSPVTKLHIAVNNSSVHTPTSYTNNGVKALTLRTAEGDGLEWHLDHSTNAYTGWVAAARVNNTGANWGNGYLEFTTASSSSGAGNANVLVLTGTGNVGIGTATPSFKLNVSSSPSSEPYAQALFRSESGSSPFGGIVVSGNYQAHIRFLTGTGTWGGAGAKQWQIRSGLANNVDKLSVYSWTASADVMTWNAAGNVGIGTTGPTQKLQVSGGNIQVASSGSSFLVSNGYGYFQDYSTYGARLGRISFINMNSGGSSWDNYAYHGIGSTDASANFGDSISINSYNDITLRLDSNNNNSASYFRIMNNTTGNNIISYIGFDGTYSTAQLPSFVGVNSGPTYSYNLNVNGNGYFSGGVRSDGNVCFTAAGNRMNGHHYFDAYDVNGNHYPHYIQGSCNNGAKINLRVQQSSGAYDVLLICGGNDTMTWRGSKIWTAANDGSGSTLDADLLDGYHGAYYLNYNNFSNTPTIPTNNNQLTNGAGYTTCTGTTTASNAQTFTNKCGNISQWTNDVGYVTSSGGSMSYWYWGYSGSCYTMYNGYSALLAAGSNISLSRSGNTVTISASGGSCGTVTSVATGGGLTGGTITTSGTISHADTSSQSSCGPLSPNRGFMKSVYVDGYGHVTSMSQNYIGFYQYNTNCLRMDFGDSTAQDIAICAGSGISITSNSGIQINNLCASDYRLKSNLECYDTGYDIVKSVNTYKYQLNHQNETSCETGMIAHELQRGGMFHGITGEKDQVNAKNEPVYQCVSYSALVPTLWSALRKSIDKIERLENKVAELENRVNILGQCVTE